MAGGIDEYTKLMLHCDGADQSTSFPDVSDSNHTVTAYGNAEVDTDVAEPWSTNNGIVRLPGGSDYLQSANHADWDLGTIWTIDFWVRFSSLSGTQKMISTRNSGDGYEILKSIGNKIGFEGFGSNNTSGQQNGSTTVTTNTWYHVAVVTTSGSTKLYVDGILEKTYVNTFSWGAGSNALRIGRPVPYAEPVIGWMEEIRFSKGIARWTSNFTPPTSPYVENQELDWDETVNLDDSWNIQSNPEQTSIDETINLDDSWNIQSDPEQTSIDETITLVDSWDISSVEQTYYTSKIISYNPLIYVTNTTPAKIVKVNITDPTNPIKNVETIVGCNNAKDVVIDNNNAYVYVTCADGKIIKINVADLSDQSIINVNDTDDMQKVDTLTSLGLTYASTDNTTGELYLIDERETELMDSDFNCLHEAFQILDNDFACIEVITIDSDCQVLAESTALMNSDFKCLDQGATPNTPQNPTASVDSIVPMALTDVHIYIDDVELVDDDVDLKSVEIIHNVDEQSLATFKVTRKHDDLNHNLNGDTVTITNQNIVKIIINGNTEFEGEISELSAIYNNNQEEVIITALQDQPNSSFNDIVLSLPGLTERLNLYHIMIENPQIYNPYINPNEENPKKYQGIRVCLGEKIKQSAVRYTDYDMLGRDAEKIQDGTFVFRQNWTYFWSPTVRKFGFFSVNDVIPPDKPADVPFEKVTLPVFKLWEAELPTFQFEDPKASGEKTLKHWHYIGTSLSPVSDDLWYLYNAKRRRQRVFDDIVTRVGTTGIITQGDIETLNLSELSSTLFTALQNAGYINGSGIIQSAFINFIFEASDLNINYNLTIKNALYELLDTSVGYYVGQAPFKDISVRNGIFLPVKKWVDEPNGLYSIREPAYNYEEYAKTVADLEYEKLKNINGTIFPETSTSINLTLDAYYYFGLKLLSRINIDNTTSAGIYNNSNGFPVAIKSITIDTATMQVTIQADNLKSNEELEAIDGQFPDELDEEYTEEEQRTLVALKSDMKTGLKVE